MSKKNLHVDKKREKQWENPFFKNFSKGLNFNLIVPSLLLLAIGLVAVASASNYKALVESQYASSITYLVRQIIFALFGGLMCLFVYRIRPEIFRRNQLKNFLIVGMSVVLVVVFFLMPTINGAKGWIVLGPISIQPVEFLKPLMILLWADYLDRHQQEVVNEGMGSTLKKNFKLPLVLLAWLAIVFLFPDTGGVLLLSLILIGMTLASGIPLIFTKRFLGWGTGVYLFSVVFLKLFNLSFLSNVSYKLARLISFANPFRDAKGTGLQLVNSYYALAMGGLLGQGPGNSIQKTGYLPEAHTDFIMAIVGEEYGFIGMFLILLAYFYLIFYIFYRAKRIINNYHQLIMIGIGFYFLSQILVNLGGITGLIPITGVTFPFISYGGSSILTTGIMLGLALAIDDRNQRALYLQNEK